MTIYSVNDPLFASYGQVVTGLEDAVAQILPALSEIPLPEGTGYVPTEPKLQNLPAAEVIRDHCFGGMPTELGWCCGDNRKLNCLEYHRDSEFNLSGDDFIPNKMRLKKDSWTPLKSKHSWSPPALWWKSSRQRFTTLPAAPTARKAFVLW